MFEDDERSGGRRGGESSVDRPTRPATDNRELLRRPEQAGDRRLLPSLEPGALTLVDVEGDRGVTVLQSLVLDHLLVNDGPAYWIDAEGFATTTAMHRLSPSRRLLDRIHVARGFTAHQHWAALQDLPAAVADTSPPALVVAPAVDAMYRTDTLARGHGRSLLARALATLGRYAEGYDAAVLLTRTRDDEFTAPVGTAADRRLECHRTRMGPRFVGEGFETTLYPVDGGEYYQTTLTYWQQLLEARAAHAGVEDRSRTGGPDPRDATTGPSVGRAVTAEGGAEPLTASPLLDAWQGSDPTGGV